MPAPVWSQCPNAAADPQGRSWLTLLGNLGRSPATVDAYGRGLDQYLRFCRDLGIDAADATLEHVSLRPPPVRRAHSPPSRPSTGE